MTETVFTAWPRRRWIAAGVLTPVVGAAYFAASGVQAGSATMFWLLLTAVAAATGATLLVSYLPASGLRPDLGCTPCAALAGLTLVGATLAMSSFGPGLVAPALAIAVTLFGLTKRLGDPASCAARTGGEDRVSRDVSSGT